MDRLRNDLDVKMMRERVFMMAPAKHMKIMMNVKRRERLESISLSETGDFAI